MNHTVTSTFSPRTQRDLQDRLGRQVIARLNDGTAALPHDISERLRAARMQALAQRKLPAVQVRPAAVGVAVDNGGGTLALGGGSRPGRDSSSWWARAMGALPLLALAAGLVAVTVVQNDRRANELAEVDSALLTDELPPAAYSDPGFAQFLRSRAAP